MFRRSSTPEGPDGFTLFHHSLRQHMETSGQTRGAVLTARRRLCQLSVDPGGPPHAAAPYLFRAGITHLLELQRTAEAISLLTWFDYLMSRLERLPGRGGVLGVGADWRAVLSKGPIPEAARPWEEFWRRNEYQLLQGSSNWSAQRILHQLGTRQARLSPVCPAARSWEVGRQLWAHLVVDPRDLPERTPQDACAFVLPGHTDTVNVCRITSDRKLAFTASGKRFSDFTVRIWDLESHDCVRVLLGHQGPIRALAITPDGRLAVSGDATGRIRVWNAKSGDLVREFLAHPGGVSGLALHSEGCRLVSGGRMECFDSGTWNEPATSYPWRRRTWEFPSLHWRSIPDGRSWR